MNKNFCHLPWTAIVINGETNSPCCRIHPKHHSNSFNKSLKDAFNSTYYKELRKQFLNGEKPDKCNACWIEEDAGVESYRQHKAKNCTEMLQSYDIENPVPRIVDLAFNPYCNAACIMCDSSSSDKWYTLDKELTSLNDNIFSREAFKRTNVEINWTPEDFANIRQLEFGNNEAMLDPNFKPFLDKLNKYNEINNISLVLVTNASYIPKQSTLDLLKQFKHINLIISLDAIEEQAEYIRYPLKWNDVINSINFWKDFVKDNPNFFMQCNTTVSIFNVFNIQDIENYWLEVMDNLKTAHKFNFVRTPSYLNPQILPDYIKEEIINSNTNDKIIKLIQVNNSNADQELEKFFKFVKFMDGKRNLDYTRTFPMLYHLIKKGK